MRRDGRDAPVTLPFFSSLPNNYALPVDQQLDTVNPRTI